MRLPEGARWLTLLLVLGAGCFVPRERDGREDTRCASCHGDPSRAGDALLKAAPPNDIRGNSAAEYPGVGAHLLHVSGGATYRAVPCAACHRVPAELSDPLHNDGVTQVVLDGGGTWDLGSRTCSGTACHRAAAAVWTRPRSTAEACGSCHGVPPPPPHPQGGACAGCHGELDAGLHVDGVLQVGASCSSCHGSDDGGAPPRSLDGGTGREHRGVGAHAVHLSGGATTRAVPCEGCHEVPSMVVTPRHPNGGPAEVTALTGWDAGSATCATGCHFGASPQWTSQTSLTCSGCHGSPPPPPHPQLAQCSTCHPFAKASHVNGVVELAAPATCDGCHGSAANPAPPRDLDGGTATSRPGVGAHQVHLSGSPRARTVPCGECHLVPAQVFAPQHPDGVTQVRFSGVAIANLAMPRYENGTCAGTACHDVAHFTVTPGGGTDTAPVWTRVDGGQVTCTSCHGQPPPPPHPVRTDCAACHPGVGATHVNGRVDFVP